jgi:DNA-binding transcriptional MerR regulator
LRDYGDPVARDRIAQLADGSGFTASTLRYEQVGVLDRPVRTAVGYRVYDDAALERLALVDRAKRRGFALQEIGDLVRLGADGDRTPTARRSVAGRAADARSRLPPQPPRGGRCLRGCADGSRPRSHDLSAPRR